MKQINDELRAMLEDLHSGDFTMQWPPPHVVAADAKTKEKIANRQVWCAGTCGIRGLGGVCSDSQRRLSAFL